MRLSEKRGARRRQQHLESGWLPPSPGQRRRPLYPEIASLGPQRKKSPPRQTEASAGQPYPFALCLAGRRIRQSRETLPSSARDAAPGVRRWRLEGGDDRNTSCRHPAVPSGGALRPATAAAHTKNSVSTGGGWEHIISADVQVTVLRRRPHWPSLRRCPRSR